MENGDLDWVSLFTDVRDITNEITDGNQTPIFSSNIFTASLPQKAAPAPKPVQPSKPKTTSPSVSKAESEQDWMNIIGTALDNLIDTRQNETNRIAQAESLESVFAPGAVVRVMSTDGNQVIDKDSAEEFIGRLATSRILLKVVPVSIKTSGDRITEMRVKETYRK